MKTIETLQNLVRVAKNHIDNQKKVIGKLQSESDAFTATRDELRQKMLSEANPGDDVQLQQMAGKFLQRAHKQAAELDVRIQDLAKKIEIESEKLRELFAEQKRYEILLERKLEERKQRLARLQQDQLDEMGSIRLRRRNEEA